MLQNTTQFIVHTNCSEALNISV